MSDEEYQDDLDMLEDDDNFSLEQMIAEEEAAEAAEHDEESAALEAEAAEETQAVQGKLAKRVNQGFWTAIAQFFPVAREGLADVYGASPADLSDKIRQGEGDIQRLLEHYNIAPETLVKVIEHPAVGAGLYVGTSLYSVMQAQKIANFLVEQEMQKNAEEAKGAAADGAE